MKVVDRRQPLALLVLVVLAVFAAPSAQAATTRCVDEAGSSTGIPCYDTIQHAVAASANGDTINVHAGTYTEQVDVATAVTIQGAGPDNTRILSPDGPLPVSFTGGGNPHHPLVYLHPSSGTASLSGLTVDGNANGDANNRFDGVAVTDANAAINDVNVVRIRNRPFSGVQAGVGVIDFNTAGNHALSLTGSTIADYQKNGVAATGPGLTATINGNTVQGQGAQSLIAQNGIQLGSGAGGTISNNFVTGHECNHATCGSDPYTQTQSGGILLFNPDLTTVSGNQATGNDIGVLGLSDVNAQLTNNLLNANRYVGVYIEGHSTWTVANNAISGGNFGVDVATFDGDAGFPTVNLTGNAITGNVKGLEAFRDTSGGGGPGPSVINASFNRIAGNAVGVSNLALNAATITAQNDWWGCNAGPGSAGCDTVVGPGAASVNTAPRLVLGVSAAPGSIQTGGVAAVTATLTQNSAGQTPSGNVFPFTPIGFATTLGSISSPVFTTAAAATSALTSGTPGTANVTAALDNQSQSTQVAVTAPVSGAGTGNQTPVAVATVSSFGVTNSTFRRGSAVTPTISRKRAPIGTAFKFRLDRASTVRIAITQLAAGKRSGRRCVAPSRRLARARSCTRRIAVGQLQRSGKAGDNRVAFSGRIGALPLSVGRYEAQIVALDALGRSSRARTTAFRIVS
ncbi:MAG TPA: right-handed parallel beta-helix repeat-containing protein [Solirubrobacteraceae bacterium]|nr:right-handed parallel beta-helix repeat-containing protein [Solirubrobacteraceae bacterium]